MNKFDEEKVEEKISRCTSCTCILIDNKCRSESCIERENVYVEFKCSLCKVREPHLFCLNDIS